MPDMRSPPSRVSHLMRGYKCFLVGLLPISLEFSGDGLDLHLSRCETFEFRVGGQVFFCVGDQGSLANESVRPNSAVEQIMPGTSYGQKDLSNTNPQD